MERLNVAWEIPGGARAEKKLESGCDQVAAAGKRECICERAFASVLYGATKERNQNI